MAKTKQMLEVEERLGKPLEQAIKEIYARRQTIAGLAEELGVKETTVYFWITDLGLELKKAIVVKRKEGN